MTKVTFVDRWPLFGASETTYPIFTGQIKNGFVDRNRLFAGVVMHRFDLKFNLADGRLNVRHTCLTVAVILRLKSRRLTFKNLNKVK